MSAMNEELFRKKSLDKVTGPEALDDYMKVTNPGIWLLLAAVIVLLIGACIWGFCGVLDTTAVCTATAENGVVTVYSEDAEIGIGMTVKLEGEEYTVSFLQPAEDGTVCGGFSAGLADGVYRAELVTERISPISFLIN